MADRPILFSAPMVRALLDGRKTQTRRIIKPQPTPCDHKPWPGVYEPHWKIDGAEMYCATCGNGVALTRDGKGTRAIPLRFAKGDRLYVRETFSGPADYSFLPPRDWGDNEPIWYWADGNPTEGDWTKPKPGIHQPRWASRLTLTVTDVRVQRLQEISRADALAEGVEMESADPPFYYVPDIYPHSLTAVGVEEPGGRHPERCYGKLWNHINGAGSWEANPWILALTFTVEKRNIDAIEKEAA